MRNSKVDAYKGILIWLVVLGHVIQYGYKQAFDNNYYINLIYSFHMPAFMFVSGFLSNSSKLLSNNVGGVA